MSLGSKYVRGDRLFTEIGGKSLAKQSMSAECDINNIMSKYQKTGAISHFSRFEEQYGDVSQIDFFEAVSLVKNAQDMFDHLPSSIRDRFGHDPGKFLEFVQDANNRDEMIDLGLMRSGIEKEVVDPPPIVAPVAPVVVVEPPGTVVP